MSGLFSRGQSFPKALVNEIGVSAPGLHALMNLSRIFLTLEVVIIEEGGKRGAKRGGVYGGRRGGKRGGKKGEKEER